MVGHNLCFYGKMCKIIPKLSRYTSLSGALIDRPQKNHKMGLAKIITIALAEDSLETSSLIFSEKQ